MATTSLSAFQCVGYLIASVGRSGSVCSTI